MNFTTLNKNVTLARRENRIKAFQLAMKLHIKPPFHSIGRSLDKAAYEYGVSFSQEEEETLLTAMKILSKLKSEI